MSSSQALQSAATMCAYFVQALFRPASLMTLADAYEATCEFFCEPGHGEGRQLFTQMLRASARDNRVIVADHQNYDQVVAVYERMQEYLLLEDVRHQLNDECTFDDPRAQLAIGAMYRSGDQVKKSAAKAAIWLERAAGQNETRALLMLGRLYLDGDEGLSKDSKKAVSLLTRAADLGDENAMALLGGIYCTGTGVETAYGAAANWLKKAALLGVPHSQGQLGYLYAQGLGVERDLIEGFAWTHLAAESGAEIAVKNLPIFSKAMTDQQRQRGLTRAAEFDSAIVAASSHQFTRVDLMNKALKSKGAEAVKWLKMAAERGDHYGAYLLAGHYLKGDGVTADAQTAFQWYIRAANAGNGNALFSLVEAYANGCGIDRDEVIALMYFCLAEEHAFRSGYKGDRGQLRDSFRRFNYKDAYAIASALKTSLRPEAIQQAKRMAATSKIKLPQLPPIPRWVCAWDE